MSADEIVVDVVDSVGQGVTDPTTFGDSPPDKDEPKANDDKPAAAPTSGWQPKWKIFWLIGILSLVADQVTKIWARHSLPLLPYKGGKGFDCYADVVEAIRTEACRGQDVSVIGGFWDWRLSMNPGSAFGLFSGQTSARVFLSVVGIGAVFGMVWMLKKARPDQKALHWALAFVAGGAVGNLIDRIYFGVVTDMVSWHYKTHSWPVFNVADVVLVIGVGLMFIDIQKEGKREKALKAARKDRVAAAARKRGLVKDLVE